MNVIADLKFPVGEISVMFLCEGDDGEGVVPGAEAIRHAVVALNVPAEDITWHAPDAFDIRYGSSYVATAMSGDRAVRFHMSEGTFQEGDDK